MCFDYDLECHFCENTPSLKISKLEEALIVKVNCARQICNFLFQWYETNKIVDTCLTHLFSDSQGSGVIRVGGGGMNVQNSCKVNMMEVIFMVCGMDGINLLFAKNF